MTSQTLIYLVLGCLLIITTPTLSRSIFDLNLSKRELLTALRYLESLQAQNEEYNNVNYFPEDDVTDVDLNGFMYDPSLVRAIEQYQSPPVNNYQPPWNTLQYNNLLRENQYDQLIGNSQNQYKDNVDWNEVPIISNNIPLDAGPPYEYEDEDQSSIGEMMDTLLEDALMEEILDGFEETEESSASDDAAEQNEYDVSYVSADLDLPSEVDDAESQPYEESNIEPSETDLDDGFPDIDKNIIEAVIMKLADERINNAINDDYESESSTGNDDTEEAMTISDEENQLSDDKTQEIDDFINGIMTELQDGAEQLADKLVGEIEEEKAILDTEDQAVEQSSSEEDEGITFGSDFETEDGEGSSATSSEVTEIVGDTDDTCPVLGYFLDDCAVVDQYEGLGSDGYKEGFSEPCNRHQLCYLCGGSFNIPHELCDNLYLAELSHMCNGDPECTARAKMFWLSAMASRVPSNTPLSFCTDECVVGYLLND